MSPPAARRRRSPLPPRAAALAARGAAPLLLTILLAAAGCEKIIDPMRYIPQNERNLLQAEARLGDTPGRTPTGGRISVDDLLGQARGRDPAAAQRAAREPLVLRFPPGATQPDEEQRARIERFAAAASGAPRVLVVARRGDVLSGPDAMLAQRRAVAVARLVEPMAPNVEVGFAPDTPGDQVILVAGGGGGGTAAR